MASIPSKHPRQRSHTSSTSFRPSKVPRSGGNGLDKGSAIVLDDSDDDNIHDDLQLYTSIYGGVTSANLKSIGNAERGEAHFRRLDERGFSSHLNYALRLFDHDKKASKRRPERIIVASQSADNIIPQMHLKSKWLGMNRNNLNIFFERSIPLPSKLAQYSHIAFNILDNVKFSDVASHIYECLGTLDDFFSIEFALHKINADDNSETPLLTDGCGHSIIRGDSPVSGILDGGDEIAMRVRLREYITVASTDEEDYTFAVTPASDCTISQIRYMAAMVWKDKEVESMRLFVDERELEDDSIPLIAWGLSHMSRITCSIEKRECSICADDIGHLAWPSRTTSTCVHEVHNCTACIQNWIASRLDNNAWNNITCLEDGCDEIYQAIDIQLHSTAEENDRYLRLSIRAGLAEDPNFHWCIGPECESGQIHDGSGGDIFSCTACGYKSCSKCERPWHHGETCEQYTARLVAVGGNEAASTAFILSNTKECPGCKSRIQKDGGCDHMTCRKCRNQFCWLCSADYKEIHRQGNTAHAPNCQYHSGNIPDPHAPLGRGLGARAVAYAPVAWRAPVAPQPVQPIIDMFRQARDFGQVRQPDPAFQPLAYQQPGPQNPLAVQNQRVVQWLAGANNIFGAVNNVPPILGDVDRVYGMQGLNNPAQLQRQAEVINDMRQRAQNAAAQAHHLQIQTLRQARAAREGQVQRARQAFQQDIQARDQEQGQLGNYHAQVQAVEQAYPALAARSAARIEALEAARQILAAGQQRERTMHGIQNRRVG